ncbi:MAG: DoxX family membrane protein [Patescibacteria group bacterium]|nr:DoxX family membrane protein [Patescibacteria group bacterium]
MTSILLRVALSFSFLYPAYGFWKNPVDWIGYIPSFMRNFGLSEEVLLIVFAFFHVVLALWLLSGWHTMYAASVAVVFLVSVVVFNLNQFNILFRDISLALTALALVFHRENFSYSHNRNEEI